jgi:hypothetical protein
MFSKMKKLFLFLLLSTIVFTSCDKLFGDESNVTSFTITKNSTFNVISLGTDIDVVDDLGNKLTGVCSGLIITYGI